MAKILITFFQPVINNNTKNLFCYYESFINELIKYGNNVYAINTRVFDLDKKRQKERTLLIAQEVEKIKTFSPDLIIAFNNQCLEEFIINTNCPIALFDADSVDLFVNIDLIKKYNDRYYMVTNYEGWDTRYQQLGFSEKQICSIHPATSVQRQDLDKDKNISFIGSCFNYENKQLTEYIKNDCSKSIYKALTHFWQNNDYDYQKNLRHFCKDRDFTVFDSYAIFDSRIFILSSILDLDLHLYGMNWERLANANYALASAFDREPKFTLKHNQDIYNSSKINISISHPQTNGYAFPWRIYDIMASSGVLISSQSDLLNKYTKGIVKIPMYSSPYDARDLCKKYLKEENLRNEISLASNEFIEKHGRWNNNFKTIQELTGVLLLANKDSQGNFEILTKFIDDKKNKRNHRIKNINNALYLLLTNIPIVEKLFSEKKYNRLYKSIKNHKRESNRDEIPRSTRHKRAFPRRNRCTH